MERTMRQILVSALTLSAACATAEDEGKWMRESRSEHQGPVDEDGDGIPDNSPSFTDAALDACVRAALGGVEGTIDPTVAAKLQNLDCIDQGVVSLNGIDFLVGLQTLSMWENSVTDISALANLSELQWLELGANDIADISALSDLTDLTRLGLSGNQISNVKDLDGLSQLEWLHLDDNALTEIDALADMTQLDWLTVEHNALDSDDVLKAIEDRGADVYGENQAADGPEGPPAPKDLGAGAVRAIELGSLSPWTTDAGTLELDMFVRGESYPVRLEVPGTLTREGTQILLHRGSTVQRVGHIEGGIATLCADGQCRAAIGAKIAPDTAYAGTGEAGPVYTLALAVQALPEGEYGESNTAMIDYALASPNQFDGGSCLFMSNTGAMEILLNQHSDLSAVDYDGETDLSERFLMSAYQDLPGSWLPYWLTDTVYAFNYHGGALLSRDYPFTAGYVRDTSSGTVPCESTDDGAYYSCQYNWFDKRPDDWESQLVQTPAIHRTVMYADPARSSSSQWNVGLMDDRHIERIKYQLRTRRAPVIVIYNHYLYWHADIVVGYDDSVYTGGCSMVESSMDYFDEQGAGSYTTKIEAHMRDIGECSDYGIFYVRDSIYDGTSDEEMYTYDDGFTERYSQRIIERSYNWVKYLGNHAYGIHRQ
jgi:hypothetical protein